MRVCPVCARPGEAGEARCRVDGASLVQLEAAEGAHAKDLSGQVVDGRYFVERIVGRGGMGTVYAARHVVVGRRVALKVLKPAFEHREETLARFVREAQAANAVKSRYIVRADDFGQLPNGSLYVVMDLLEGRSLGAALRQRLLTREQLLRVFVQVAEGLGAAHQAGVVHRDLKPDNVFLVDDDVEKPAVRILDFGVAKLQGDGNGLTSTGVILGTPNYMSPEQARGHAVDHRADIYALGVVMYQAFTGRLPFVADSAVGVLTAHAVEEPARPALSGVDAGLEAVILRCMRKRPGDRFASMAEVAAAVRALWGAMADGLPPAPPSRAAPLGAGEAASFGGASGDPSAASSAASRGFGLAGSETGSATSASPQATVGRGVYVALGAGLALVGVVGALLVVRPFGLLGRSATPEALASAAPASASTAGPSAPPLPAALPSTTVGAVELAGAAPTEGTTSSSATALGSAAPAPSASSPASGPPPGAPPAGSSPGPRPPPNGAPPSAKPGGKPPARPRPGAPDGIRSPF